MRTASSLWIWRGVWALSLLVVLGVFLLYARLPVDGATGDLESFTPEGYRVQWLLEERAGGLQVGDVIVRAGGYTPEEWLRGAPRGSEWRNGEVVYQIVRDRKPVTLHIQLSPVPLWAILTRWTPQLLSAVAFFLVGTLVFWRRSQDPAARLLMLFCIAVALQYWGDAYNLQFSALPWGWPFWLHVVYEHGMYSLSIATVCYFALVFPTSHPLLKRFPRRVVFALYASHPLIIMGTMALFPTRSAALTAGSRVSWILAIGQMGLAVIAGARSVRTARDPVTRAQIRWILWSIVVGGAVLIPGYALPMVFGNRPLLPHPVMMIMVAFVPASFAIAILRYRLFDIEVLINRSLVYGTLTTLLGGLYLLLVRILTMAIQGILHRENDTLVVFTATLSIALAFAPLRQRVQILIDRTFYRTKLDYQRLLPEISERLATSIILDQLISLLIGELPQRLQLKWATLDILDSTGEHFVRASDENHPSLPMDHSLVEYLRRGHPILRLQPPPRLPANIRAFLDQHEIELSIPLIVGTELVGLYNLGPKRSGDPYNQDEVRFLQLLGQQAAVAVENGRLYEQAQQEIAERVRAEEQVKASLREKEVLLQEIHHRVKNNLQIISSLLHLQAKKVQDPQVQDIFRDSQNRVRSMALIHEKMYQAQDLAGVDFDEYIHNLAAYLFRAYSTCTRDVTLRIESDDVFLPIDTAVPCGLVLNELISNALKHAFPGDRGGQVHVEFCTGPGDQYILKIGDDGVGLPPDLDLHTTKSLGLQLINTLVDQLGGTIELDTRSGAEFKIAFLVPRD